MANTIRIKRGKSNNLSVSNLQDGELALTLDTNKLYTNKGQISPDNVYVGDTEPTDSNVKCWISPSGKIDLSSLWDQVYPVGSIYITVNATNPSVLFGGVWEKIEGRFLIGTGSNKANTTSYWGELSANNYTMPVGEMGGEAKHTLSVYEMPKHTHPLEYYINNGNNMPGGYDKFLSYGMPSGTQYHTQAVQAGGDQPHNNIPPYYAVNMWQRIS